MPYIQIATTRKLTDDQRDKLRQRALDAASLLGKRREFVMVRMEDGCALQKGDAPGSCAFCDVRVLGKPTPEDCNAFARALSDHIADIAQTDPKCVYLSIAEMTMCYTDGCLPPGH